MTGYTVHSGTSDQYASGWDAIFGGAQPAKNVAKKSAKKAAKSAKKGVSKKSAKKAKKLG